MPTISEENKAAPSKKLKKKVKEKHSKDRKIAYKGIQVYLNMSDREEGALTDEKAKEYLGWWEEGSAEWKAYKKQCEANYHLTDFNGKKVFLANNVKNRSFTPGLASAYRQEILRKKWEFNGETMIIGETGLVLSCAHRMAAIVLACQEWEKDKERWVDYWPERPTMDALIVCGISEDDKVVNTIDTGRSRSLADAIFRSVYFQDIPAGPRKTVSRLAQYAIFTTWDRTGGKNDESVGMTVRRTNNESLDFLGRHETLLPMVRHIFEEDHEGGIERFISPGVAAGLCYLMACSTSDPDTYLETRDEISLSWELRKKAEQFFTDMAKGGVKFKPIKQVFGKIANANEDSEIDNIERTGVLIKAFKRYAEGKPMSEAEIDLKYKTVDDEKQLAEFPEIGGIDIGPSYVKEDPEVSEEEVEAAKKKERKKKEEKKTDKKKTKKPKAEEPPEEEGEEVEDLGDLDEATDEGDEE